MPVEQDSREPSRVGELSVDLGDPAWRLKTWGFRSSTISVEATPGERRHKAGLRRQVGPSEPLR